MFHTLTFLSIRIVLFNKAHLNHATRPQLSFQCQRRNGFAVERYCACVQQKFKFIMVLAKAKAALTVNGANEAYCKWCRIKIHPKLIVIKLHGESKRHKIFETSCSGSNKLSNYLSKEGALRNEIRRAELMITAFLLDHNTPFRVTDHLSNVLSRTFPSSTIAREPNQPALPIIYLVKSLKQN